MTFSSAATRPGPRRALLVFTAALIVIDLASATALTPLLPWYTGHGFSEPAAGILMGAYPLGCVIGAVPGGLLAGCFGSRAAVMLGLAVTVAADLVFGWNSAVAVLVAARLVQGAAGSAVWAGGLAWLSGSAPPERRGADLGTVMGCAAAGALAGPAVGAVGTQIGPGPTFSMAAAVSAALLIPAWLLPAPGETGLRAVRPGLQMLASRGMRTGIMLTALGGAATGMLDVLAPLRLSQLGAAAAVIAGAYVAAGVAEMALARWAGRASDRHGQAAPARILLAAATGTALIFPLIRQPELLAVFLAIGMPAFGALCTPGSALLSASADQLRLHQGTAFGLGNFAWSGGQAGAALAAGATAQATSDIVPAALVAGLCLLALTALLPAPAAAAITRFTRRQNGRA